MSNIENLIIIGSGPAGHTAAIYAARANLEPLMFEGFLAGGIAAGGQLTTTTEVENFPGFPTGIDGTQLMNNMREQSINSGTRILTQTVDRVDFSRNNPEKALLITSSGQEYKAKTVIIATGATAKKLPITGLDTYRNNGISGCAVCDGALPIFRNKPLAVIGGGDVAMEEAMHLSKFGSKVYLIVRRDVLRASKAMQERVMENPKIEILWNTECSEAKGDGDLLQEIQIMNNQTNESSSLAVGGLFFAIGHAPNTGFLADSLTLDESQYILLDKKTRFQTMTSVDGVFAAGDVCDKVYRQAITSAGTGCMAALEAEAWLGENLVISSNYMLRPVFLMFFGEFLIIYAENYAAKNANTSRTLLQRTILTLLALCSGLSLIFAYKIGYQYRDNIRIVVALSIGSIVFVEPIISWTMFQEIPNAGAVVGGLLGFCGMCCAIFWK